MQQQDVKSDAGWLVFGLVLGVIAFATTGCSFQVGMDWHGQTGVDKRVQTELVNAADREPTKAERRNARY